MNALRSAPGAATYTLPASVCVYCGTGQIVNPLHQKAAAETGRAFAEAGVQLVYGGGSVGLMGIVSAACMDAGGRVTGIIPGHLSEKEGQKHDISELHVVDSMHARKQMMVELSDGFVVLPGGMGTLDETFEILTRKYMALHDKPVEFLNVNGIYDPLIAMIDHMVTEGFTPQHHLKLFTVVERVQDVLPALTRQPDAQQAVVTEKM